MQISEVAKRLTELRRHQNITPEESRQDEAALVEACLRELSEERLDYRSILAEGFVPAEEDSESEEDRGLFEAYGLKTFDEYARQFRRESDGVTLDFDLNEERLVAYFHGTNLYSTYEGVTEAGEFKTCVRLIERRAARLAHHCANCDAKSKAIFTIGEVATVCHVRPLVVCGWFNSGELRGYRMPGVGEIRITREHLIQFLKQREMPLGDLVEVQPPNGW